MNSSAQSRQVRLGPGTPSPDPPRLGRHDARDPRHRVGNGSAAGVLEGVRARSARARSPELIAEKIRVPSSPFEPISQPDAPRGTDPRGSDVPAPCRRCRAPRLWPPSSWSSPPAPARPRAAPPPAPPRRHRAHRAAPRARRPATVGAIEHPTGRDRRGPALRRGRRVRDAGLPRRPGADFTLYGDGTVIFRNPTRRRPPAVGIVMPLQPVPHRQADRGADPGRCSSSPSARAASGRPAPSTTNTMVADASTAIFTVNAGGLDEDRLGLRARASTTRGVPDLPRRARPSAKLRDRLRRLRPGRLDHDRRLRARRAIAAILIEGQPGDPEPEGLAVDRTSSRPTS